MNNNSKSLVAILAGLAVICFLGWFFSDILIYIFVAFVLSLLGSPLMRFFTGIRIGKWHFPSSLAAAITLIVIIFFIGLLFYMLVPAIVREVTYLTSIDIFSLGDAIEKWVNQFDKPLRRFGILSRREHLYDIITAEWVELVKKINMSSVVSSTANAVGSLLVAVFSILFMTFFSLKDHNIFFKMIRSWLPNKYQQNFDNILNATGKQVSSYFRGVLMEMFIVGLIEFLVCLILKVPNAYIIGLVGGALNIIPYVGPIIAGCVGILIGVTSLIPLSPEVPALLAVCVKIVAAFVVAKGIDDFVLQPLIYGKSTHSHPLEIFIVILMAGYLGGVFAMIFAVPAYTLLRIVVNEFFGSQFANEAEREKMLSPDPKPAPVVEKPADTRNTSESTDDNIAD